MDGVDKVIYAVPGVPHEMYDMMQRAVMPDLAARSGDAAVIASRVLRTWGESESGLNERLDDVIEQLERPDTPTLAFLASGWEGLEGPTDGEGGDVGRLCPPARRVGAGRSARNSARSCSESTTTRWSRWCSMCAGAAG